jgi:uncharacterized protein YebE (UPF0316 family)
MDLREMGWKVVKWLAQNRDFVKMVLNLWVSIRGREFLD